MTSTNGIYLGNNGLVELQRISAEDPENIDIRATLLKSDVDTTTNSISFDLCNLIGYFYIFKNLRYAELVVQY